MYRTIVIGVASWSCKGGAQHLRPTLIPAGEAVIGKNDQVSFIVMAYNEMYSNTWRTSEPHELGG